MRCSGISICLKVEASLEASNTGTVREVVRETLMDRSQLGRHGVRDRGQELVIIPGQVEEREEL